MTKTSLAPQVTQFLDCVALDLAASDVRPEGLTPQVIAEAMEKRLLREQELLVKLLRDADFRRALSDEVYRRAK